MWNWDDNAKVLVCFQPVGAFSVIVKSSRTFVWSSTPQMSLGACFSTAYYRLQPSSHVHIKYHEWPAAACCITSINLQHANSLISLSSPVCFPKSSLSPTTALNTLSETYQSLNCIKLIHSSLNLNHY